jgi:uncharacterized protein
VIHVSIHDVSPAFARETELALELAAEVSVKPALLVVPNFHGAHPLSGDPKFCARLRDLQAQGHEIFLHGYEHRAPSVGSSSNSSRAVTRADRFAQTVMSQGEAEFFGLSADEAERRLTLGEQEFERAGLRVDGFVAPAWGMRRTLLPVLGRRGYHHAEDHLFVYDPVRGEKRASVVLNYASRTPTRMVSSVAWARLAKYAAQALPGRIAIHPGDMTMRWLRYETRTLLAWARGRYAGRAVELLAA